MKHATAKTKWIAIQAVRWSGLAMFLLGMLITANKVNLPHEAGYVLISVGLFDNLFLPKILARMWKTPQ